MFDEPADGLLLELPLCAGLSFVDEPLPVVEPVVDDGLFDEFDSPDELPLGFVVGVAVEPAGLSSVAFGIGP